jgi:hypothetical protein
VDVAFRFNNGVAWPPSFPFVQIVKQTVTKEMKRVRTVDSIDWHKLALQIGSIHERGESGGTDVARQALELIIGPEALRGAVDYYVAGHSGSELARSVLSLVKPAAAIDRCLEIARSDTDVESRQLAVELLRVVADARGIQWAGEFLNDVDEGVQIWAAGIVDQLLWSDLVDSEDCRDILEAMAQHKNGAVQERAVFIRSYLAARQERAEPDVAPAR